MRSACAVTMRGVATSCPASGGGQHIQDDLFKVIDESIGKWDLLLFFWQCTNMCVSGARHFHRKKLRQARDVFSFRALMECGIARVGAENPIGVLSSLYRKPDQIIQPWQFGHGETKATCLWLKNLPPLKPTNIVEGREGRVWKMPPGPNRWKERSRTFAGIADAMAEQWGTPAHKGMICPE